MTALHRLSARLSSSRPRQVATLVATVLIGGAIVLFLTPPAEYLPEGEEPKTFASMSAPPGYNLSTMKAIADEVEAEFLPLVGADPADYDSGELDRPPMKYVNMGVDAERLRIIAEPVDPAHMEAMMDAITEVYQRYPGMGAFAARGSIISSNDGGTRSVTLDVAGADLAEIYTVASRLEREAEQVFDNPRIQSQPASLSLAQPLIEVHPRWNRAAEVQFSTEDLGFTVAALTDGAYLDEFFLGDDKIDIYAYSHRTGTRPELAALPGLPVHTPIGATVPLSSLATLKETVDTSVVRRVNGRRTVTLNIIPPRGVALETGVSQVRAMIQQLRDAGDIPDTISITLSGASDQLQATQESLSGNYVVALILVYLLLVAIFTHWGFPLLIMTTIPLGIASGLLGLAMMNGVGALLPLLGLPPLTQPFDMITMLGFLILMGTVVNNPILIVHQATLNFRENAMNAVEAVNDAVASRLRPIAMTTITTVCGLAPLVLIPGEGTELYRGVGAIVLFGLLGTAIVTITFLPALTALVLSLFRKRT
jgi:multidrug efflux pump subunit AcrB